MSHPFFQNAYKARYHLGFMFGSVYGLSVYDKQFLKDYVYGQDGNGGDMLKIHTYLTDQEMASLRFQKRYKWHAYKQEKDAFKNTGDSIVNEELSDLGINFPKDKYVEYNKRPPHDFYI